MKRDHPEVHWVLLKNKCDVECYVDWLALLEHSSDGRSCGKSFVPKMVRQGMAESRQPGHDKSTLERFRVHVSGNGPLTLSSLNPKPKTLNPRDLVWLSSELRGCKP